MLRRVVVTGIGTINPIGNNCSDFFANLDKGQGGAQPITAFDVSGLNTRFACQIPDFDPRNFPDAIDRKCVTRTDPFEQYALIAACEAIKDSRLDLDGENLKRFGVVIGSGVGGVNTYEKEYRDCLLEGGGSLKFSPFLITKFIINMASGIVALKYGFRGPNYGVASACSTSSHAILTARDEISFGRADVMVTGGSDAPICASTVSAFSSARALSSNNDEYATASRPFDRTRDGFVLGEGAAILVLEELNHAVERGARIYAEVAGVGMTCDAYSLTAPRPDGEGAADAMSIALKDAGIGPEEVDYINAHGTSTPLGDVAEINAIKDVFGKSAYRLNVSSTKSMTGHLLGASGAVESLACIHAINEGIIPPTINFREEDEKIDYRINLTLNKAQHREVNVAISNNFGFGGQNACLVFRKL